MLRPSGATLIDDDIGPERVEHERADRMGGAVGAVEHDA